MNTKLLAAALLAVPLTAQWLAHPTPGIPRTPDGKPNLSAPAPRTADGKPDGTFMALRSDRPSGGDTDRGLA